jgi:hypothetical protein
VTPPPLRELEEAYKQDLQASDDVHNHAMDDEVPGVVAPERPPALRRHAVAWSAMEVRGHVLADGARRDLQAQLELQFVGDTPLTPGEVLMRHLPDERLQLDRNGGPSRA